jgi:hypothetical protein
MNITSLCSRPPAAPYTLERSTFYKLVASSASDVVCKTKESRYTNLTNYTHKSKAEVTCTTILEVKSYQPALDTEANR